MTPLTTAQAAERLGLTESGVKYLLRQGYLTGSKFGWVWSIDARSVENYLRDRPNPGPKPK